MFGFKNKKEDDFDITKKSPKSGGFGTVILGALRSGGNVVTIPYRHRRTIKKDETDQIIENKGNVKIDCNAAVLSGANVTMSIDNTKTVDGKCEHEENIESSFNVNTRTIGEIASLVKIFQEKK